MLKLSLVTPAKKLVFNEPVEQVFVPSYKGELNILEGHAPLVATLTTGVLKYKVQGDGALKSVVVSSGFLEVLDNHVIVLAETAERPEEIDVTRAKTSLDKATKMITSPDLEPHRFQKYQLKIQRATLRIQQSSNRTES